MEQVEDIAASAVEPPPPPSELWKPCLRELMLCALVLARGLFVSAVDAAGLPGTTPSLLVWENQRLRHELDMLRRECAVKDARMAKLAPTRRPHYAAKARLEILFLMASQGYNLAQAARVFLVTRETIARWVREVRAHGAAALVAPVTPVNRYDDAVTFLVQQLARAFPFLSRRRMAELLARAGLQLAASTVERMVQRAPVPEPPSKNPKKSASATPSVVATRPNEAWGIDITVVPTMKGFWSPRPRHGTPVSWPYGWHVAVVMDQCSRLVLGTAVFPTAPRTDELTHLLGGCMARYGASPQRVVSDSGGQFKERFAAWLGELGIRHKLGRLFEVGSLCLVERFNLTLKTEGLRDVGVLARRDHVEAELEVFRRWYNERRGHMALGGRTPVEAYLDVPSGVAPRIETRARYPAHGARRVAATALGAKLTGFEGRSRFPTLDLDIAA